MDVYRLIEGAALAEDSLAAASSDSRELVATVHQMSANFKSRGCTRHTGVVTIDTLRPSKRTSAETGPVIRNHLNIQNQACQPLPCSCDLLRVMCPPPQPARGELLHEQEHETCEAPEEPSAKMRICIAATDFSGLFPWHRFPAECNVGRRLCVRAWIRLAVIPCYTSLIGILMFSRPFSGLSGSRVAFMCGAAEG
jgi:hypothetical protein